MYWNKIKHLSNEWDKYGFVNELEIRIEAGLALILALSTFFIVMLKWDFKIWLAIVWIIWLDFVLKIFIWPNFSIFGNITRIFIRNKEKIWVWSVQKRFAWSIGLVLSTFVIYCMLLLGWFIETTNPQVLNIIEQINTNIVNNKFMVLPMNPAILACVLCIVFMFLESVFWICVGCKMYKNLVEKWIMKEYKWQNCINWACEISRK